MVKQGFSIWRHRAAAFTVAAVTVCNVLSFAPALAAQQQTPQKPPDQTPAPTQPGQQPTQPGQQPTPSQPGQAPAQGPSQPGQQPAAPGPTAPGQQPNTPAPAGQPTNPPNPAGQSPTAPTPAEQERINEEQQRHEEAKRRMEGEKSPLGPAAVPDRTVLFPETIKNPRNAGESKTAGFQLPTPGTGVFTNPTYPQLPLFGWKFFESARAIIDARRAYFAKFAGFSGLSPNPADLYGSSQMNPFTGTTLSGQSSGAGGGGLVPTAPVGAPTGSTGLSVPVNGLSTPLPTVQPGAAAGGGTSASQLLQNMSPSDQAAALSQLAQGGGLSQLAQGGGLSQLGQGGGLSQLGQAGALSQLAQAAQGAGLGQQGIGGTPGQGAGSQISPLPQLGTAGLPGGSSTVGGALSGATSSALQFGSSFIGNHVLDPSHNILTPDEMSRFPISTPAPDRYQLGPGDDLEISVQSPTFEATSFNAEIDNRGRIVVPITGKPMVARGLTLNGLESALRAQIRPALRNASVVVTLAQLRTMSIAVLGESYAPGSYLLPATVSLFNAIYASGGPSLDGSMRNILLRRANGFTRTFDLYKEFVTGDASDDVALQPGDVVYIPPADSKVLVMGEVKRPATYEIRSGERLKDAIRFAGGTLPTGISQKIAIESVQPGSQHVLVDAGLVGTMNNNPLIYAGDTIDVYSINSEVMNAVSIDGAVQTPRAYALSSGMTVADLVDDARGLKREAYPDRADLFRQNPDKTEKLIRIDLSAAIARNPAANIKLKAFDHLVVYTYDEVRSLGNRNVTVTGAVRRPGTFYRADNMSVRDVLLEAGGLALNAYTDTAFLQRTNPDGTPGELIKLNLNKLLSGDPAANVPMQDLDVMTVETVQEANYVPDEEVQVVGAVQRPGVFTKGTNMKVSDLLKLSGGVLPTAYEDKAFLQRMNLDGRVGPLVVVDLKGVMSGDPASDVSLNTKDTLYVYTKDQAQYQAPQIVTVHGSLQSPGTYSKAPNMHLRDVLLLAGGPTPNASDRVEIAKARVPDGTPIRSFDLQRVLAGDPTANVAVEDGDMVSVPEDSNILMAPLVVHILGEVVSPGPYLLTTRTAHLSDLVKLAGGLKPLAFPEGAEFFRDATQMTSKPQATLTPHIVALLKAIAGDTYTRALARGDVDKVRAIIDATAAAAGTPVAVGTAGISTATPTANATTVASVQKARDPVTPARPLIADDLQVLGNLNVSVPKALAHPHSGDDLILVDGDSVTIPQRPVNVQVVGAVVSPEALMFHPGKTLGAYLQDCGGFTTDADKNEVLIIRSTGNVRHANSGTKLMLGDVVFIPTTVMTDRLRDRSADFSSAVNTITSAGLLLAVITALTK